MCDMSKLAIGVAIGAVLGAFGCMVAKKDARAMMHFKKTVGKAIGNAVDSISDAAEKIADSMGID